MEVEWTAALLNHTTLQQCWHMIQNGDGKSETSKTCQKWLTFQLYEDDVEGLQEPRAIENANNRIANAKLLMPCYTLKEKQNKWNSTIALENSNKIFGAITITNYKVSLSFVHLRVVSHCIVW
jgi:hypothetical protein